MLSVVGLGNPGASYRNTRHNVGFMVLDGMAEGRFGEKATYRGCPNFCVHKLGTPQRSGLDALRSVFGKTSRFKKTSGPYVMLEGEIDGASFLLVKPTTFMNESGKAVTSLITRGKVKHAGELLIVVDDVDLELGRLRIRERGSAGGHNGLKSITEALGTEEFARLRIGTGPRPNGADMVEYVLESFLPGEREIVGKALERASRCIEAWITGGIECAHAEIANVP